MSLWAELKRRNVFRVGAAYVVVGWVLIQGSEIILPRLGLPDWTVTFMIVLVAFGLPLALFLAWAYELTPQGIRRTENGVPGPEEIRRAGRGLDWLIIAGLAGVMLFMAAERLWFSSHDAEVRSTVRSDLTPVPDPSVAAPPGAGRSIAVLPFANMSPDPENEYFADGIAEELLNILARIEGLRVASRTSAFSFRGTALDIPAIAARLGVAHILEGSVRRHGSRVRITAQLIDARTDQHLWSETYDRELTDIFVIQEEIAQAITDALSDRLGVRQVTVRVPTRNLEAYELFLRGRQMFAQRGAALIGAREMLERAVTHDPDYAAAWAVLAAVYYVIPSYDAGLERPEGFARATQAAERALALDADQPTALSVLGALEANAGRRVAARELLKRALAADSNDANTWLWLALGEFEAGHIAAARASLERARLLDPLAAIHAGYLGHALSVLGETAAAAGLLEFAVESGWRGSARWYQFLAALAGGPGPRAASAYRTWYQERTPLGDEERRLHERIAVALEDDAAHGAAAAALREWIAKHPGRDSTYLFMALSLYREAIAEALRVGDASHIYVLYSLWHPHNRPLRELPEFMALAKANGLLEYWEAIGFPDFCRQVTAPQPRLECER
jgi:adenylate cyclase